MALGVVGVDVTIEEDIFGILVELIRRRLILTGNHYATSIAVACRVEHLGIALDELHKLLHICLGVVRFDFHHQLESGVEVGIRFAAVHLVEFYDRIKVETLESEVRAKVFEVVAYEQLAILKEHVALNRIDMLRISLIERHCAHIVVMRVKQSRELSIGNCSTAK